MMITVFVAMRVGMRMPVAVIVLVVGMFDAGGDSYFGGRLWIQKLTEKQHQHRAGQREEWDEPNRIEEVHAVTI